MDTHSPIDDRSQKMPYIKPFPKRLHVVIVIFNQLRLYSRYENFWAFHKRVEDNGGIPYVVELAFGDREFEIVKADNPRHLGLRTFHELWHKERMIRLAIQHLVPSSAEYIAWVDADVGFARPDICQETLHQLQHYHFVQMFSHAIDCGPDYEPLWTTPGFIYEWVKNGALNSNWKPLSYYEKPAGWTPVNPAFDKEWKICHPGLAFAADRGALNMTDGGIFDLSIFGSGDFVMCLSWVGMAEYALAGMDTKNNNFAKAVMGYQNLCNQHIKKDIGYVPGAVLHYWHGRKSSRQYDKRPNAILAQLGFDPVTDIKRDSYGLYQLTTGTDRRTQQLRDQLRQFARARVEDGIEL